MGGLAALKLLLDTHVWVWSLVEPSKLSRRTIRILRDPKNQLWLSSISLWEVFALIDRGRIRVEGTAEAWVARALQATPVNEAPLTWDIVKVSRQSGLAHQDPADRFLAGTAKVMRLTLVTGDDRLLKSPDIQTLAAR